MFVGIVVQSWLLLILAIVLEVAGTTSMKLSEGLTRLWPTVGMTVLYLASFACLALALKQIEVSIAYAIWAGLGIVLVTLVAVLFFDEALTPWRVVCMTLVLLGVVGLNLSSSHS
ncbi:DMT family transporter [Salinisphaera aquimarina]|uniref:DMT family transporter n=1 Tax=Salinisphaera aquimarina TaxID=2094031 RepID=A0ABV7EUC7_9GAMM